MAAVTTALRRDGTKYRYKVVSTRQVPSVRNVTDAEIRNGRLVLFFSDGSVDDTGIVGTTIITDGSVPDNSYTSRFDGDLILSPITGEQLVGAI